VWRGPLVPVRNPLDDGRAAVRVLVDLLVRNLVAFLVAEEVVNAVLGVSHLCQIKRKTFKKYTFFYPDPTLLNFGNQMGTMQRGKTPLTLRDIFLHRSVLAIFGIPSTRLSKA
jgi:hypothetical protein